MSELRFVWDEKKNQRNKRIHGIAFEEAETVYDENAILFDDPEHSEDEDR
ncbi:MAG: BrnT family toxin, partial [Lachnospiraceae bacterium]|nr:BrnT family toxin [Lachnospiraceae bacterium]